MLLSPAYIERMLLAAFIVTSGYLFWVRFRKVLSRIRASRPDPDFHFRPVGRRIFRFFAEVMCQSKVIRERPLPGIAHAFVFWGFCVFALITLNHFAAGFGWPVFDRHGAFGRFYW